MNIISRKQSENAIKWIEALLSGKYKQGTHFLGDKEKGFCCWGLGCYISKMNYNSNSGWNMDFYNQVGFWDRNGELKKLFYGYSRLDQINDITHAGFKRIGKMLIQTADLHFNFEVAKEIKNHFK